MRKLILLSLSSFAVTLAAFTTQAASDVLPKQARNMSAAEVRHIYQGNTWKWGEEGAYFGSGGEFYAVSGTGKALSLASGRWLVTKGGRLCFAADWSTRQGTFQNVMTCFNHAEYGGRYYQAKGRSGKWYEIKSAKQKSGDMLSQIVPGDLVKCRYVLSGAKLKQHLSSKQSAELKKLEKSKGQCHAKA